MGELAEFIRVPADRIDGYDVAALNLRCAQGLPGAEDRVLPARVPES
jgi:hypothetical protein